MPVAWRHDIADAPDDKPIPTQEKPNLDLSGHPLAQICAPVVPARRLECLLAAELWWSLGDKQGAARRYAPKAMARSNGRRQGTQAGQ